MDRVGLECRAVDAILTVDTTMIVIEKQIKNKDFLLIKRNRTNYIREKTCRQPSYTVMWIPLPSSVSLTLSLSLLLPVVHCTVVHFTIVLN